MTAWTKAPESERRAQILDAALRVAADVGLHAMTLRAVATRAGVSHGLILFHFGSRRGLVDELLTYLCDWLSTRAEPASAPDNLNALVREEVAAIDHAHAKVLFDFWLLAPSSESTRQQIHDAVAAYRRLICDAVQAKPVGQQVDSCAASPDPVALIVGSTLLLLLGELD